MLHSEDLTQWNFYKFGIGFPLFTFDVKTGIGFQYYLLT